jgi:hypothetical protein
MAWEVEYTDEFDDWFQELDVAGQEAVERAAILLIGGDKTGRWRAWYDEMIPRADDLYDDYLRTLREEGLL